MISVNILVFNFQLPLRNSNNKLYITYNGNDLCIFLYFLIIII